jgi:nuclear transport factor 2 (NTF2) superfamily protein
MTKILNRLFFFLHQNQNIFFSNIGNQNIFLEKNHEFICLKKAIPNEWYHTLQAQNSIKSVVNFQKDKFIVKFLSYNQMLNSGKKFRALRDKKNKYSNSCVVQKKNSERNKKP